ncbi:MAG: transcriptional repressor [Patescibacteria group bacterium]|nr:transcriptional repressor [Patescibacteria group bacterium]
MKTHYYRDDIIKICDKKHLTVEQIFEEINKLYDDAGKSSIYRNVEDMVKTGDLKKVV